MKLKSHENVIIMSRLRGGAIAEPVAITFGTSGNPADIISRISAGVSDIQVRSAAAPPCKGLGL